MKIKWEKSQQRAHQEMYECMQMKLNSLRAPLRIHQWREAIEFRHGLTHYCLTSGIRVISLSPCFLEYLYKW